LAGAVAAVVSERSSEAVLARVAEVLDSLVPCDDIAIWECAERCLTPLLVRGRDAEAMRKLRVRLGEGLTGQAALANEPLLVNEAHLDPRARHVPGTEEESESIICVPLAVRGSVIGVLSLYRSSAPRTFEQEEFELARGFADVVAVALDNANARSELERLAATDDLTGLANRRRFRTELERELAAASREGRPLALLLLDLDGFKAVNDSYGHDLGDEALRTIGAIIKGRLRRSDLAARIGGDEFAILLPNTSRNDADHVARDLRDTIANNTADLALTASIGIATTEEAAGQLLTTADRMLYTIKRLAAVSTTVSHNGTRRARPR